MGTDRRNNFGFLRLVFAFLVIVSHSFELVDGNRDREPLTYLIHRLSLGELGVDGFFIVSGYLVTQSFQRTRPWPLFLWHRILRIYPGYIAASLICLFVVGPIAGGDMTAAPWALANVFVLGVPTLPGAFYGLPIPALNGSMWTISYEFCCYLLVIVFGLVGLYKRPLLFAGMWILIIAIDVVLWRQSLPTQFASTLAAAHLIPQFCAGSAFYLFRNHIPYRADLAFGAVIGLCSGLVFRSTFDPGIAIFGGYLVFWLAFLPTPRLNMVNNATDISYGVYLYAWPVQSLLIWFIPGISPVTVLVASSSLSACAGLLSWRFIEAPALALKWGYQPTTIA